MIITSFSEEGYTLYGKRFLDSYLKYHDEPITVYYEEGQPDYEHDLVTFKDLFKVNGCVEFLKGASAFPAMQGKLHITGKYNYRFDVFKFCRKSFAQVDAASYGKGWLYWVDADVEFTGPILFPKIEDVFMVYLGRPGWHSCASFVGWNLDHPMVGEFCKLYWMLYMNGDVFALPEWHDSYILDWIREQQKFPAIDLAGHLDLDNGPVNVFNEVFTNAQHKKGNLKFAATA